MSEPAHDFENDLPIDDALVALDLLCKRWGDNTIRILRAPHRRAYLPHGPYIEVAWVYDHADSTVRRYSVTERVIHALVAERRVRGTPQWGYTDDSELRITELGEERLWEARAAASLDAQLTSTLWLRRRAPAF